MTKIAGWFAIILALLSLAPSAIPGAVSIIGLIISLTALFISLYSVIDSGKKYFYITLLITSFGVFFINDAMRLWNPLAPVDVRVIFYAIFLTTAIVFTIIAYYFAKNDSTNQD